MTSSTSNSNDEKLLTLSDGRVLAYAENGNVASRIVVLNFHGALGIGRADKMSETFKAYDVHFIAPTLPGWGKSSPRPRHTSYAANLLSSMTELVLHVHPDQDNMHLYIAGGSYGTVPAQVLYGAPFDAFPLGRHIKGCLILAPFSPFRWHKGYTKSMTWQNYISVGPPAYYIPFRVIPILLGKVIKSKLTSVEATEKFIRENLFDHTSEEEKAAFAKWRVQQGYEEGQFERQLAESSFLSMQETSVGFEEIAEVIHSDWGFKPDQLDDEHTKDRPLLIVASTKDDLGPDMAKWLEANYPNSSLQWVEGGHISSVYESDRIWREFLKAGEGSP